MNDFPPRVAHGDRIAYAVGIALLVFGIVTGLVAWTMVRAHTLNPIEGVVGYFVPSPEAEFGKERIYVLVLGLDYDYNNLDEPMSKDSRTDKVEAFAIDFPSKVVSSVAVPRDLDAIVQGHEDKLNDAYHYGGWRATDAVVGPLLGLAKTESGAYFDRYVVLRINASKELIDAIGGLDVPVTETIDYDDNWGHLHIHFKPGLIHMNGDQAVSYARFRHDACSDPCRIRRQQQIEHLIIEKLRADKLNDLTHVTQLIDVVHRNVDTNFTPDELKSLGWYFRDLNVADVHSTQIPYASDKELNCCGDVLVVDDPGRQKIAAAFVGPYVAVTPPPSDDELAQVKPADVRIDVRNGSGIPGLAAKAAAALKKDGYVINSVGNADSFDYTTTQIRASTKVAYAGERVRRDLHLPAAGVSPLPDASPPSAAAQVTVVVGRDYAAPTPQGASAKK